VLPEIAVAKVNPDAPFDKICYIGCGVTTGVGAVLNTAKVEAGATAIVFGLGGIGLNVIQGLRLAGADMIIGVDPNDRKKACGERFGMTHFVNPTEVGKELVPHLVNMTKRGADQIGGADYTFNVTVMRQALEASHRGWGQSIIIGVAGAGRKFRPGRSNWSPGGCGRERPSAARADAPMCPGSSTGTWPARSRSIRSSPAA
jgi:S-(hydroxymethyl)glutathione dehydrogenase / alcohol dehydrogenase